MYWMLGLAHLLRDVWLLRMVPRFVSVDGIVSIVTVEVLLVFVVALWCVFGIVLLIWEDGG